MMEYLIHFPSSLLQLNSLNGLGLGAAAVFSKLVDTNINLVEKIDQREIEQFLSFIRILGPDATWLQFLKCLCSCKNIPIAEKQQQILRSLYFQGERFAFAIAEKQQQILRSLYFQGEREEDEVMKFFCGTGRSGTT
jgi:hypothetical protein